MQVPNHVQEHIDTIAKHEQEFLARRSPAERLGDLTAAIVGNLGFVAVHILLFSFWILVNTLQLRSIPHFDPVPFSLLGTIVAMEAIILASLILMRQARLARRADEREHLMLQILLLTEKEVTAVISMNRQIASKVGLRDMENSKEIEELGRNTSIDEVAQDIQRRLSEDLQFERAIENGITVDQIKGFSLFMIKAVLDGRGSEILDLAKTNLAR